MLDTGYFKDHEAMESIAERINDSVIITTSKLTRPGPQIVYVNPAFCKKTGYTPVEIIGKSPRILQGPATEKKVIERLRENLKNDEPFSGSTINYRKNGSPYVVAWNIKKFWSNLYEDYFYISIQKETTREYELDRLNHSIIDNLGDGVIGLDHNCDVLTMNPAAYDMTGCDKDVDISSANWNNLLDWDHNGENKVLVNVVEKVLSTGDPIEAHRDKLIRKDGSGVWVEMSVQPMQISSESRSGGVVTLRDISDQKEFEKKLWSAANQDELTRAYNRHFAKEIMTRYTRETKEQGIPVSLIYFDIDDFKVFNDVHGHGVGDEVLKTVVNSVNSRIRKNDYLIRWGGEEFIIIIPSEKANTAVLIAESIRKQIEDLSIDKDSIGFVDEEPSNITVSMGVAEFHKDESIDTWIERADNGLMQAKETGKNRVVSIDKK